MQIIKLVENGKQDKMIGFEELPKRLLRGLRQDHLEGYPRGWEKYVDSTYELFYKDINRDIERWAEITSFCRRVVDPSVRLLDKIEDMSKPVASNQTEDVKLYPDQITVISIPLAHQEKLELPGSVTENPSNVGEDAPLKHTCEGKGRGGKYEDEGKCGRCDELRAKKLVEA